MKFFIDKFEISENSKTLIVAEISANHNNNLNNVFNLILEANKCGADIIKIQCYNASDITIDSNKKDFKIDNNSPWSKYKNLWNLYKRASTPSIWMEEIFNFAKKNNITIFASVFSLDNVNLLEKLNTPAYKIASPEINHIPLLERIAKTKKPVLISTGLATKDDISLAIKTLKKNGNNKIILLKCTSAYPAPIDEANVKTILNYKTSFKLFTGLSDHTLTNYTALASVCLGAKIVEKHFKISNTRTPDSFFSLSPIKFKKLINEIRLIEKTLGKTNYNITNSAKANNKNKRSIYIKKDIYKNELVSDHNISVVRPGLGLHPKYYNRIIGKRFKKNILSGSRVKLKDLK
jgi:pseudaminic acid synthase